MMQDIDARGKPCPKPVMMAKKALEKTDGNFRILLDSRVSVENVRRFLESQSCNVSITEETQGTFILVCSQPSETTKETVNVDYINLQPNSGSKKINVLVTSNVLGSSDEELGEVLMKGFLSTLASSDVNCGTIALMNGGVLLALPENSASESLRALETKGWRVLVCGTCTNHYGITDRIAAGSISNMFEITESLLDADNTLTVP
ncbi:MAG TPA: sulfurtransferase-like selenium metabolism protein YedF [Synergistaceae bacterium]|jgi:selenium metabolism protein YedF|nr:MAG: Selenium metabolism protein YedF [Synergistales bacterium 53_16]KUL05340.1 MAG: Selenium metabolism protein YedF [Synergistales bacterium 54_9]MDK2845410.1 hypothetical protein [Synergistales bacterium]HAA47703.1 sulfurtransferase-like selenium metabolism protein YedF [Synergistaceae bacterium]MDN5335603.1 hypothetical protein [Synergistales bacterium]